MVTLIKANQPVQNWTRTHKYRKWLKLQQILNKQQERRFVSPPCTSLTQRCMLQSEIQISKSDNFKAGLMLAYRLVNQCDNKQEELVLLSSRWLFDTNKCQNCGSLLIKLVSGVDGETTTFGEIGQFDVHGHKSVDNIISIFFLRM